MPRVPNQTLIGICDTWGVLAAGEIYACVAKENFRQPALQGKVLVTRSPIIHPGDCQFATAIGEVPDDSPLADLVNVVVFSAKGTRPLVDMLGGGDLDGDLFNIITDCSLFPLISTAPGAYTPVDPHKLNRPSNMTDLARFVVQYFQNDAVGRIANRHLVIADQSPYGAYDPNCLELAELASRAVDFQKSGVPVTMDQLPRARPRAMPDFMTTPDDKFRYPSKKALGRMFRAVPIQKYARPKEHDRKNVDASVLYKILQEVEHRYAEHDFQVPTFASTQEIWERDFLAFCNECKKVAFRNTLSRRDEHKLCEEELFLATNGSTSKVEAGEKEMMHRVKTQMQVLVDDLRRNISPKRRRRWETRSDDVVVKNESDDEDEDADYRDAHIKEEEESAPEPLMDWLTLSIGRAFSAAYHSLHKLEEDNPPFGTRLFAYTAVSLLLSLLRRKEENRH